MRNEIKSALCGRVAANGGLLRLLWEWWVVVGAKIRGVPELLVPGLLGRVSHIYTVQLLQQASKQRVLHPQGDIACS